MRRSPMKRGGKPLKRTPMKRGSKPIRQRSAKMARYYAEERVPAVVAAVGDGRRPCQAPTPACTGFVKGIHEVLSRGRAGGLRAALRDGPTLDVCHACNRYISEHPKWSEERDLLWKRPRG